MCAVPDPRADVPALRALVAVARSGTVGRAAERLGRTQPSISARLATLEAAWGTRLFRRVARGMELTPEGARLLPLAEAALRDLEALDRTAGLPVSGTAALRVGAGDALGRERVPRALAELMTGHPGLEIHLREGPAPRLLEALRDGEIDLALVVRPSAAVTPDGIRLEPLIHSDVHVLAPVADGSRGRRAVPLRALAGRRLVALQPGSGFRRHLEAAFAAAGIPFRPAVEVGNLSLVRRFVAAGLGMAPVPAVAFESGAPLSGVDRRRLAGVPAVSYFTAVRSGAPRPEVIRRFVHSLRRGHSPFFPSAGKKGE